MTLTIPIYENDLSQASNILDPIMFAYDTSLFYCHHRKKIIFETVNCELEDQPVA